MPEKSTNKERLKDITDGTVKSYAQISLQTLTE